MRDRAGDLWLGSDDGLSRQAGDRNRRRDVSWGYLEVIHAVQEGSPSTASNPSSLHRRGSRDSKALFMSEMGPSGRSTKRLKSCEPSADEVPTGER